MKYIDTPASLLFKPSELPAISIQISDFGFSAFIPWTPKCNPVSEPSLNACYKTICSTFLSSEKPEYLHNSIVTQHGYRYFSWNVWYTPRTTTCDNNDGDGLYIPVFTTKLFNCFYGLRKTSYIAVVPFPTIYQNGFRICKTCTFKDDGKASCEYVKQYFHSKRLQYWYGWKRKLPVFTALLA